MQARQHPDLSIVQAESEGGVLKVEQVREVRRTLALKPYQAKYRIALFLRFQEANDSAANALLKTLEEAPAYAILLLTADAPEQLLPTIVSRCEVLRLRPSKMEDVERELESRGVESGQARLIAHVSGGRAGFALRVAEDDSFLEVRQALLDDLQRLLSASRVKKFDYAEKLSKDKEAMRQALLVWLSYWRDVLLRASGASAPIANIDREQEIAALAGTLQLSGACRLVQEIELSLERLEHTVNPRLLAEVILLDLPHV
ncbi:MAG: DNA polymerase III subunit delta' [Anaerolineales bacterium]